MKGDLFPDISTPSPRFAYLFDGEPFLSPAQLIDGRAAMKKQREIIIKIVHFLIKPKLLVFLSIIKKSIIII